MMTITNFQIIPGYYCNLKCAHCSVDSGPNQIAKLSSNEINIISQNIIAVQPKKLIFTGGEPTYYIHIINEILSQCLELYRPKVLITTNGCFAMGGSNKVHEILSSFKHIDELQLSMDKFHKSNLKPSEVQSLIDYTSARKIKLNISYCISTPMDFVAFEKMAQAYNIKMIYQLVDESKRSLETNSVFQYPAFQSDVLKKKCPVLDCISYFPGQGFSHCCSKWMLDSCKKKKTYSTVEECMNSVFFKRMYQYTFGDLVDFVQLSISDLLPQHSSPCCLCRFLHNSFFESMSEEPL